MATNIELERQVNALDELAKILKALNLFFDQAREGREWTAAKRAAGIVETSTPELPLAETSSLSFQEQRKLESDNSVRALLKSCGSSDAAVEQVLKV